VTNIFTLLSTAEIVKVHNFVAKTPVTKFRDRRTAEAKVDSLTMGMGAKLVPIFKKAGISDEIIAQLEENLKPKPAPESNPKKGKKEAKAEEKEPGEFIAHPMLQTIRELVKKSKKDQTPSSADIAETLGVKFPQVIEQCKIFSEQGLINIEDDSVSPEDPFYYIHLTELGLSCKVAEGDPSSGLSKAKKERVKKEGADGKEWTKRAPGQRMNFDGKTIKKLVKENPKMKGSTRWEAFELAKDGMSYDEFVKAGGSKKHIIEMVNDALIEVA
jgi:hypothetical protein